MRPESAFVAEPVLVARRLRLLPDPYLYGFFRFFRHSEARPSFLLGQRSESGFAWYYFPATFALKTPLGADGAPGGRALTWRRHAAARRVELFLWLPVVVYLALTLTRGLNIGHRHLLPIYPFLFVAAGRAATLACAARPVRSPRSCWPRPPGTASRSRASTRTTSRTSTRSRAGPRTATGCSSTRTSTGDRTSRGCATGWRAQGIARAKLSYFGTADPEYYRIAGRPAAGLHAAAAAHDRVRRSCPGDVVAVSATNLQGVYVEPEVRPLMALLRARAPIGQVGYSILVYRADFAWSAAEPLDRDETREPVSLSSDK